MVRLKATLSKSSFLKKGFYTILHLPEGKRVSQYFWAGLNNSSEEIVQFRSEEDAYKYLFQRHMVCYRGRDRDLQLALLLIELREFDSNVGKEMFLLEKSPGKFSVKAFSPVSLFAYLKRKKMFKVAFKLFCDSAGVFGFTRAGHKICFEHYEITLHPLDTDMSTL